jgi:drug/metabolite transporter (DMT)-like permease
MTDEKSQQRKAMLMMALCAGLWSIAGIFIKWISWHPLQIAGGRSILSGLVLLAFMKATGRRFIVNKYSLLAGIGLSGSCISFVIANKLTTAANAIVLQYTAPIFILLMSALFLKAPLKGRDIGVVLFTGIGIALFFFDELSPGSLTGNLLGILAGIFLALMFVSVGLAAEDDSVRMSGILLAHFFTAVIGTGSLFFTDFSTTGQEVLFVVILGIFQLGIPYVLYALASRHCSPLACSLIGTLEPLLNPVWVLLFYGEVPGRAALVGAVIVLGAISAWLVSSGKAEGKLE